MGRRVVGKLPDRDINKLMQRLRLEAFSSEISNGLLSTIAEQAYFFELDKLEAMLPPGWKLINSSASYGYDSGYGAFSLYHVQTGSVIIANTGTEFDKDKIRDLPDDGVASFGIPIDQQRDAIDYKNRIAALVNNGGEYNMQQLLFTGHSLGSALSGVQMLHELIRPEFGIVPLRGIGVGGAGFGDGTMDSVNSLFDSLGINIPPTAVDMVYNRYTNYVRKADLVPWGRLIAGGALGKTVYLPDLYLVDKEGHYSLVNPYAFGPHNTNLYTWSIDQGLAGVEGLAVVIRPNGSYVIKSKSDIQIDRLLEMVGLDYLKCFVAGTAVAMADGTTKPIEAVQVGDRISSFAGLSGLCDATVVATHRGTAKRILTLGNALRCTPEHPFLCGDGKYRPVIEALDGGHDLVFADGGAASGLRYELLEGEQDIYNITVDPTHAYIAGGFRVHNVSALDHVPEDFILEDAYFENDGTITLVGEDGSHRSITVSVKDLDGDGNTDLVERVVKESSERITRTRRNFLFGSTPDPDHYAEQTTTVLDANRDGTPENIRVETRWNDIRIEVSKDYNAQGEVVWVSDNVYYNGINSGAIGSAFGSSLSRILFDDATTQEIASIVLETLGENIAEGIVNAWAPDQLASFGDAFDDFSYNLGSNVIGAISTYLTAELLEAAGLEGTVLADLGQSAISQALSQVIQNVATGAPAFSGVSVDPYTIIATYLGTKLASSIIEFDTVEGQIGASLGAAVGAAVGLAWASRGAEIGSIWGPVGALVGAFVGYILGGLIGSLFSSGKPEAWASVTWDASRNEFAVANVGSKNKGDKATARSLAGTAAETLNAVIELTGARLLSAGSVNAGRYGMRGKDFTYTSTYRQSSRNYEDVVNIGVFNALSGIVQRLAGGDVYVKRALASSISASTDPRAYTSEKLLGDLGIAMDYARYMESPAAINAMISAKPDSAFAAGWVVTFARAVELGLNKRSFTDWIGGYGAFLDEIRDGAVDGSSLAASNLVLGLQNGSARTFAVIDEAGEYIGSIGDTIDASDKDNVVGTAGDDVIVVDMAQLRPAAGVLVNGAQINDAHSIRVAAVINAGAGNDTVRAGDIGNDVLGGDGNDILVGGKLDDWLFGQTGDDVLFAGNVSNANFSVSDVAAETAAISIAAGNGDFLDGGDGNDRLYGGTGSDWLKGGAGADRLVGGRGGDILEGGSGDDRGANGAAAILGGEGSDQYLFGFGDGKDVIFDESDPAAAAGISRDSLHWRYQQLESGAFARNWAGDGEYEVDGSVKGGEDAIAFGAGISMANILMRRSGNDLVIQLMGVDDAGNEGLTGDELTVKDWFETTRRVEWLRFTDGEEIRLGDMTSFVIGTGDSDVILGSYGADFLYGGGGDDQIRGLAGNDFGNGGGGNDFVAGDGDNDWVLGGSGSDHVIGGHGHDTVFGDDGNDRVYGGTGSDIVVGGRGNDEVVGGVGDDVFRYSRGDGQDVVMDDYVNNWDLVWQNGTYANGYVLQSNGTVTKNDVVYFDGSKWLGQYDWDDENQVLSRHAGAAGGFVASNAGTDTLEFGVGINIQDLMLRKSGNDLMVAVSKDNDASGFDQTSDRITIKDWYSLGAPIENFVFVATGRHAVSAMNLDGGSDGDDILAGTADKDWLTGNGGDDTIDGGGETDILVGNAGADLLKGGAAVDVLFGGEGSDVLDGGAGGDLLFGGDGEDMASYASSNGGVRAYLDGSAQSANLGDAKDDAFDGIEGLQGSSGDDYLGGDSGDNRLDGGSGQDTLYGGAGSDTYLLDRSSGHDTLHEGVFTVDTNGNAVIGNYDAGGVDALALGRDISLSDLTFSENGNDLTVNMLDQDGTFVRSSARLVNQYVVGRGVELMQLADGLVVEFEHLKLPGEAGTASADFMAGASADDTLSGLAGDDVLSGGHGNDILLGGDGDDILEGGLGGDVFDGGTDSDTLALPVEPSKIRGDTIRYAGSSAAVVVDLVASTVSGGHASGDVLVAIGGVSTIENVLGSGHADVLRGDARANRLAGLAGDDTLDGRAGDDVLSGGDGADTLYGGDGADALAGDSDGDRLEGGAGKDLLSGGEGDDQLFGDGEDDQLSGDAGNDIVRGGDGHDILGGWEGSDALYGEEGNDKLAGGDGNDTLEGGNGIDQLAGEGGSDQLRGGAGSDSYLFDINSGIDTIVDTANQTDKNKIFISDAGPDRIWLSRAGNDLRVSVIGGTTVVVVSGYFNADQTGTRIYEIATSGGSLFLDSAGPLLQVMQASGSLPSTMPQAIRDLLKDYWHATGKAAPRVVDQALSTNEDVALSGNVGAVDQDANITSYALFENATIGAVLLNESTGAWTYTPAANRHGSDKFVITVTDADGNSVRQTIVMTVASVNDAPSDIFAPAALLMDEGAENGLSLGSFTHQDDDGPEDIGSFQLVDSAGGRFAIDASGRLTVLNGAALDYEAQTSHTIRVRVTDQAGASFEKEFTVTVRDVNEAPYIVTPPPTTVPTVVSEMATGGGGTVASFVIGDLDGTTPILELTTNPYGWLETAGNTVRIKTDAVIDFEALAAAGATLEDTDGDGLKEIRLSAAVRATDGALNSAAPTPFVFLIEDANDAPNSIAFAPDLEEILERDRPQQGEALSAVLLGTLSATDPDIYGSADFANIAFSVDDARFEIVNGNQLRLRSGATLDYEAGATVNLTITATDRAGAGLSFNRAFVLTVANRDDYLYGTAATDTLVGQANRDIIYGYGFADTIAAGEGNDDLYGGDGADTLRGDGGDDRLWGEYGADRLEGGMGADALYGGDGYDMLLGMNGNDTLFGGEGNDNLDGGLDDDILQGETGNDTLMGSLGNDTLLGGDGDDVLTGGMGADRMNGGAGTDTLSYASSSAGIVLNLATGVHGGYAAGDVIEDHFERIIGSVLADTITGSDENDLIEGENGNDTIYGGAGDDVLIGGLGNDFIDAQSGNDRLVGGSGNDILIGGSDSDVYLIDINAGADEIRNYDSGGEDVDAIGYQDIDRNRLWFSRSGDDLVVSVIGTAVVTTIKSWFAVATGSDRANYKIDFIIAGQQYSDTLNAEGLVELMAGYAKPASQAAYDILHQDLAFENRWKNHWDANGAPAISEITDQALAEDGTITLQFGVEDDITPYTSMTVVATADGVVLDPPTLSAPDANGVRTLTLHGAPNRSGDVTVTLTATDPGGLTSQRTFTVHVSAQADAPVITRAVATQNYVSGEIDLDIQAALIDQDGSETLEVRISNVPNGLALNHGADLGNGVWSLTPAQLAGLALVMQTGWSGDLSGLQALTITAIAKETATGQTAQTSQPFTVIINAAPNDIAADRALSVNESTASGTVPNGTLIANFSGTDPDGDTLTFSLVNNAGGRFAISTAGVLTVANGTLLDREAAASHVIRVRVTDPSGLSHEEEFTVAVGDVNEAPTTPTATVLIPVGAENSALAGQAVANLAATDPDGAVPGYTITSDPRGWFVISGNQVKFRSDLNFDFEALKAAGLTISDIDADGRQEVVYTAEVQATDGTLNSSGSRSITVRIEDVNDTPYDIYPDRALTIAENSANGSAIANIFGADQDAGDGLTFSLLNNAGGRFALTSAGVLSVANGALLDYEAGNAHTITVRVTDSFGAYRDEAFTVALSNVNEAPTTPVVTAWGTRTIQEGAPGDLHVATLASTDPDGTAPSLVEAFDPWDWFYMAGNQLRLRPGLNFDFDNLVQHGTDWWRTITDADGDGQYEFNYAVAVTSTDGALGSPDHAWIWFGIEDVNETPYSWDQGFTVSESAPGAGQTLVGQFAFGDNDSQAYNRNHVFSLTAGDTGRFSINQTTGQIYLQGSLNYEAATSHAVQVTVRDRGGTGAATSAWVTVNVANANERPNIQFQNDNPYPHDYVAGADPEGSAVSFQVTSAVQVIHTWRRYHDTYNGGYEDTEWDSRTNVATTGFLQPQYSGLSKVAPRGNFREWTEGDWYDPRGDGAGYFIEYQEETYYEITVVSVDATGLTSDPIKLIVRKYSSELGPVVLDLDGNGVDLVSLYHSKVAVDMNSDGRKDTTGWVGPQDGLLALDRNRNGTIDNGSEISFMADSPGAASDLEGLRAYDTNANGSLDGGDQRYAEFQVWRDSNQDGISSAEELWSLADLSIVSLDLTGNKTGLDPYQSLDNTVYATSTFHRADGSTGGVGDVFLAYRDGLSGEHSNSGPRTGGALPTSSHTSGRRRVPPKLREFDTMDDGGDWNPGSSSGPLAPGDRGLGDAAAGKVRRNAQRNPTPAQILASAMSDDDSMANAMPASRSDATPPIDETALQALPEPQQPARVRDDEASRKPAEAANEDEDIGGAAAGARSALHDRLALSQKKRFQMIEAMSTFAAEPYAEFGLGTGKDPKNVELLTALPDFRISA